MGNLLPNAAVMCLAMAMAMPALRVGNGDTTI